MPNGTRQGSPSTRSRRNAAGDRVQESAAALAAAETVGELLAALARAELAGVAADAIEAAHDRAVIQLSLHQTFQNAAIS